jgi:ATPase subunit of ABC transporter with duplicated ATPase domains
VDLRPLNDDEVKQHLKDFGLTGEFVRGKVERLSAGQKSRLVLAAAMWNRPHFVIFDEPTNYLDREALEGLSAAIQKFRGGVLIVSHNEKFVEDLCEEFWLVENGVCRPRDGGDQSDPE